MVKTPRVKTHYIIYNGVFSYFRKRFELLLQRLGEFNRSRRHEIMTIRAIMRIIYRVIAENNTFFEKV